MNRGGREREKVLQMLLNTPNKKERGLASRTTRQREKGERNMGIMEDHQESPRKANRLHERFIR